MRGDRPTEVEIELADGTFTPHARGSTWLLILLVIANYVYPACAGIDLYGDVLTWRQASLPRMRGDRPCYSIMECHGRKFTPHARGSTVPAALRGRSQRVYPACAGIDHKAPSLVPAPPRLPRMRGDRPSPGAMWEPRLQFTPHARGSTLKSVLKSKLTRVYPACAGIDPFRFAFLQR